MTLNLRSVAVFLTSLCLVHCLLMPFVISMAPIFFASWLSENVWLEYVLVLSAIAFGGMSMLHSYRRHHHKKYPLIFFMVACIFFVNAFAWKKFELSFIVVGGLINLLAHFLNYIYCQRAKHCHKEDCQHG